MNREEKNRAYFKETFEEVHAPEGLCRKVTNMKKTEVKKIGMSVTKKLAVAAAIAAVLFAGSNGVAYAMTGSTWLESVTARFNINGVWQEVELEGEVLEDGTVQYSTSIDVPDGSKGDILVVTDTDTAGVEMEFYMDTTTVPARTEVVEEEGRIYFIDEDVKIDITEDMIDGYAAGNFERNGMTYRYEVQEEAGAPGCFELHITSGNE